MFIKDFYFVYSDIVWLLNQDTCHLRYKSWILSAPFVKQFHKELKIVTQFAEDSMGIAARQPYGFLDFVQIYSVCDLSVSFPSTIMPRIFFSLTCFITESLTVISILELFLFLFSYRMTCIFVCLCLSSIFGTTALLYLDQGLI